MAISNFEESIKYGIERALYQQIANCLSVFEWAKIGMNSPRWISVKDRLPEEDTDVLLTGIEALNNERIYAVKVNDAGVWRPMSAPSVLWDYWMPLPEPPKEDILNEVD